MGIFVLTATYELRGSRKSHLRDHPTLGQKVLGSYKHFEAWTLLILKPTVHETTQKNDETYFKMSLRIYFAFISALAGSFLTKKSQNHCTVMYIVYRFLLTW